MKRNLDYKYQQVKEHFEAGTEPNSSIEKELLKVLKNEKAAPEVERAYDIYTHRFKREVMESFLLSDTTPSEIEEVVKVPVVVTEVYAQLFFDPTYFEDELDRLDYAYEYKDNEFGSELKRYAIELGKECLKIRLGRGSYSVGNLEVQNGVRSTAFLMAQQVKANPIDSALAREALRWAQVALRAAPELEEQEVSAAESLTLALETKDHTTNAEKSGIPKEDILH